MTYQDKQILITGGTGSLGKALVKYFLTKHPNIKRLVIFSRDEQKQFHMSQDYPANVFPNIRFFIGYSGWIPNQLIMELKRDSWVVSSISAEAMMNADPKSLWKRTLLELGGQYKNWTNFPNEPAMN